MQHLNSTSWFLGIIQESDFSQTCSFSADMWQKVRIPIVLLYSNKKNAYKFIRFLPKPQKPHFWSIFWEFLGPPDSTGLFFKNQAVTFLTSWVNNFMYIIRKNYWINSEIFCWAWTDGQMNKWTNWAKFIRHFASASV